MEIALWSLALLAVVLGLAGILLPLLPGVTLIFAGLWLAAWLDGYARVGAATLSLLGLLTLAGWLVDYLAAIVAVKRAGASNQAAGGAGAGALLGMFGGLPGLIAGPILGAIAGEWLARRNGGQAARAGVAAGVSFLVALLAKLFIALAMLALFVLAWFV